MRAPEYQRLRRDYSRMASRYDVRWKSYAEASIGETLRRLPVASDDRVLDIGCGTGLLLEAVSLAIPRIRLAGVDLSREMLEVARRRLGVAADLEEACAEALPFGDATFDVVVSTSVFHLIRHPLAALQEMLRVAKPSGKVVITDWCDDYLACRACDMFLRTFSRAYFRTYSSNECRTLLVDAGFATCDIEHYRINWLWGLMTATAGRSASQPPFPGP